MSNSQQNVQANRKEQAVFLQSGDPTRERRPVAGDSYVGGQLGQRFSAPDSTNGLAADWQIVETDSVMDTLPYDGAVAWWADRTAYLVTTKIANTGGRGNVAGIFRDSSAPQDPATHNIPVSSVVCIQKKGQAQVNFVDNPTSAPTAAGLFVIPSASDAKADCLAAGTAASYPAIGKSLSTATNHYANVDIDINDQP